MNKRIASLVIAATLVGGGIAAAVAAPAATTVGPGDDRQLTVPAAAWWAYDNESFADIKASLKANHARPVDIHVTMTAGKPIYSVAEVANEGAYKTNWYMATNITTTKVTTTAVNKGLRPTVVDCYKTSKGDRCATIMVKNSGANADSFDFWEGSLAFIESKIMNNSRMLSLTRVQGSDRYAAIMVDNTGVNHVKWWWYHGFSDSRIVSDAINEGGRIVDFDHNADTNTWNAIVYQNASGAPWFEYNQESLSAAVTTALQQGQRIFDVTGYTLDHTTYYATVSVNNLNPLSTRIAGVLAAKTPNGTWGFLLSQVGESTLASLQDGTVFEPASTIKVLYHYKTIVAEQAGTSHDSDGVAYFYDPAHPNKAGICPDDFKGHVGATNLKTADTKMMKVSDNRMAKGVYDHFGKKSIAAEASHLGMTNTTNNHDIGCPTPTTHNQTTLDDLNRLYDAFAQSKDITQAKWRDQFRSRMLNQSDYSPYRAEICPVVEAQAKALGKSSSVATKFCAAIRWIAKSGSYQYGTAATSPVSWSQGSLTGIPYEHNGKITRTSLFYGDYFDETHFASNADATALSNARHKAYLDAMMPSIQAALKTWSG